LRVARLPGGIRGVEVNGLMATSHTCGHSTDIDLELDDISFILICRWSVVLAARPKTCALQPKRASKTEQNRSYVRSTATVQDPR
jgi:hypothetical protein